jgi:hypothetical protein
MGYPTDNPIDGRGAPAAHTPGPWRLSPNERGGFLILQTDGRSVGRTRDAWSDDDRPVNAANARLIAAAPTMLAALLRAEQFIVNGVELGFIRLPDPGTPDSAHETLPAIRTAIAAAQAR